MKNRYLDMLVGLVVIGAVGAYLFARLWLNRSLEERNSLDFVVRFADARGLKGAEEVRMAGFKIGSVRSIQLSADFRQAEVTLRVARKYAIPRDSKVSVSSALLGGGPYITIVPGDAQKGAIREGELLDGVSAGGLDAALDGVGKLTSDIQLQQDLKRTVEAVRITAEATARLAGDPAAQADLKATLHNVRLASEQLPASLKQVSALVPQFQNQLLALSGQSQEILKNLESTTRSGARAAHEAQALTTDLRAAVNENRGSIRALLRSANDAAAGVAALTEQAAGTIGDKKLRANLVAATENLTSVSKNFVALSERLDATVANVQKLSGDPQLTGDLKATLANFKETSASVKNLAARIEALRLPGEKRAPAGTPAPTPAPFSRTSLLEPGLTFDSVYDTKGERYRLDAHYALLTGTRGGFWRVGLFDAAESNRIDLQRGIALGLPAETALRFGLVAGKLGVGLDGRAGPLDLRLDAFHPNRLTVNGRVRAWLSPGLALTAGVDSLGRGNRPTVGVQWRR